MDWSSIFDFVKYNFSVIKTYIPTVIAGIWWLYQFYKKNTFEKENIELKTRLSIYKEKSMLNDWEFRKSYNDFVSLFIDLIKETKNDKNWNWSISKDKLNRMYDFIKVCLLYSNTDTIKELWNYMKKSWEIEKDNNNENSKEILLIIWRLIIKMRQELWVDNSMLDEKDIIQTLLKDDIKTIYK